VLDIGWELRRETLPSTSMLVPWLLHNRSAIWIAIYVTDASEPIAYVCVPIYFSSNHLATPMRASNIYLYRP
jgi:hypothetical protein